MIPLANGAEVKTAGLTKSVCVIENATKWRFRYPKRKENATKTSGGKIAYEEYRVRKRI